MVKISCKVFQSVTNCLDARLVDIYSYTSMVEKLLWSWGPTICWSLVSFWFYCVVILQSHWYINLNSYTVQPVYKGQPVISDNLSYKKVGTKRVWPAKIAFLIGRVDLSSSFD